MNKTIVSLYVNDKDKTKMFFEILFEKISHVDKHEYCELELQKEIILRIINKKLVSEIYDLDFLSPDNLNASKNIELCFEVNDPESMHIKSLQLGSLELKKFGKTIFDNYSGSSINHDGHIIVFLKSA